MSFLKKELGAIPNTEHVDLIAGSGGRHVYENFAKAREAAKIRANLGGDVAPFLQERAPYANQVYTGMQSLDGTRGWRIDFEPKKGAHINWWIIPDANKPKIKYKGAIRIDGATEGDYLSILSHFPGFQKARMNYE